MLHVITTPIVNIGRHDLEGMLGGHFAVEAGHDGGDALKTWDGCAR